MIWFIIYLVGCAIACCTIIRLHLKESDYTYSDIFPTIIVSLLSWVSVIIPPNITTFPIFWWNYY